MDNKNSKLKEDDAFEFEDAVSQTGFGWYNIVLLVVCGVSLMSVIMETLSMSYIVPAAQCDLDLTLNDKGILSAVGFLGVVLSSLLWGFIGDTMGRRKVVLITSYISFLMGVASSLAPYVWLMITLRFLNCFFIGGPSAVVIAYLGEFHGLRSRARVITLSATFVAVASIIMPGLAWLVLPLEWSIPIPALEISLRPWRILVVLYGLPSFISATCLLFLPESPKYLWAVGRSDEALAILRRIFVVNTGKDESLYPVKKLVLSMENTNDVDSEKVSNSKPGRIIFSFLKRIKLQLFPIFCPPLLLRTFMTSFLQFGTFAGSSGYLMWLPGILNKVSFYINQNNGESVYVCEALEFKPNVTNIADNKMSEMCSDSIDEEVFLISIMIGVAFALNYMFIGTVINYTGKKLLLAGLLLVTGITGIVINFIEGYLVIAILSGLYILGGSGVTILNTSVVDLFPTQYRSIAMAVSLMAGRTGAMVASQTLGYLFEYTCGSVFFLLGGVNIGLALISLLLPSK